MNDMNAIPSNHLTLKLVAEGKLKPKLPFGNDWRYVTVIERNGTQHQLYKHRKTGELKWHKL